MTQGAIPVERWNLIEQELAARDYVRTLDLVDKLDVWRKVCRPVLHDITNLHDDTLCPDRGARRTLGEQTCVALIEPVHRLAEVIVGPEFAVTLQGSRVDLDQDDAIDLERSGIQRAECFVAGRQRFAARALR